MYLPAYVKIQNIIHDQSMFNVVIMTLYNKT